MCSTTIHQCDSFPQSVVSVQKKARMRTACDGKKAVATWNYVVAQLQARLQSLKILRGCLPT